MKLHAEQEIKIVYINIHANISLKDFHLIQILRLNIYTISRKKKL